MSVKTAFASPDSHSRRAHVQRFRFARNAGHMDMKDAKVALDIIIRPSLQLWKLAPGRSPNVLAIFKRPRKTALLCDSSSSTSSLTPRKRVRFDDNPVTISRRSFFERCWKDSTPPPARRCLVNRESCNVHTKPMETVLEEAEDVESVYEDCLSDDPSFLIDLQVLEGGEGVDTRPLKHVLRSEFYEMESGIAMFDHAGYASYCLSRWIDKQREDARAQKQRACQGLAPESWQHALSLTPPASSTPGFDGVCPMPLPPSALVCRPPRSLPWRIIEHIENELQNAMVVVIIGFLIHSCLFFFLLYDILRRGLAPSDD